jgi:hypothetical protein
MPIINLMETIFTQIMRVRILIQIELKKEFKAIISIYNNNNQILKIIYLIKQDKMDRIQVVKIIDTIQTFQILKIKTMFHKNKL